MQLRSLMKRFSAILLLHVLLSSAAQTCPRWGGVSSSAQSPLRIMSAHLTVTKPYTRIRMTSLPDADVAYPLIATYLSNPELAHSVEEFVAQVDGSAYLHSLHDPAAQDRLPVLVGESDHEAIRRHTDTLGLSPETVRTMKGALDWWRRTALARPSKPVRDSIFCTGVSREEEKLYREYASAATALLLSLCPNITTLHLGGIHGDTLEEYLLKSNYGLSPRPALQNLRHVEHYPSKLSLDYDGYDDIQILDHFRYFHRLPRISSVSIEGVTDNNADRDIFPPRSSEGIKKIDLQHVDISGDGLATILRIPAHLEELSVSIGGLFHSDGGSPFVDVGLLARSLEQHVHTLRVLDLDLGEAVGPWMQEESTEDWEDEDWEDDAFEKRINEERLVDGYFKLDESVSQGPLYPRDVRSLEDHGRMTMAFRDYTALTHLSLNLEAILGPTGLWPVDKVVRDKLASHPALPLIDALPPSLEYLCLYGYEKGKIPEFDEQVGELMSKMGERLPKLVEVRGVDELERVIDPDSDENDEFLTSRRRADKLKWIEA